MYFICYLRADYLRLFKGWLKVRTISFILINSSKGCEKKSEIMYNVETSKPVKNNKYMYIYRHVASMDGVSVGGNVCLNNTCRVLGFYYLYVEAVKWGAFSILRFYLRKLSPGQEPGAAPDTCSIYPIKSSFVMRG